MRTISLIGATEIAGDVFALTANPDDPTSLGIYTCEAVNCMGRAYSSSKVHVVGKGSREGSLKPADSMHHNGPPPIFTDELKNLKIKLGDAFTLGCQGNFNDFFYFCFIGALTSSSLTVPPNGKVKVCGIFFFGRQNVTK